MTEKILRYAIAWSQDDIASPIHVQNYGDIQRINKIVRVVNVHAHNGYSLHKIDNFILKGQPIPEGYTSMSKRVARLNFRDVQKLIGSDDQAANSFPLITFDESKEEAERVFWQ